VREIVRTALAGEEAWIVGGAVRDALLGRPLVDLDVACRDPRSAARAAARLIGGAPFALSERWGAWRVALDDGRTLDFTPLRGALEDDLATRDFTVNAIAEPLAGGPRLDPFHGEEHAAGRSLRAVSDSVFTDDPLRLLRAVRLEDELGFRLDGPTEALARAAAPLVTRPAGERILGELLRLSETGWRRLDELGLLAPLGGSTDRLAVAETADERLVAALGDGVRRLPISNELARFARVLLHATPPEDGSPRAIHRFRRATEPWSLEALRFAGASGLADAVQAARAAEPAEPLLRGDELGLPPGPEIGRLLDRIAEERAAGAVTTREQALELVRREARV
jgi:tRNA nucleotidyltransferase/poly(A) polymerase